MLIGQTQVNQFKNDPTITNILADKSFFSFYWLTLRLSGIDFINIVLSILISLDQ